MTTSLTPSSLSPEVPCLTWKSHRQQRLHIKVHIVTQVALCTCTTIWTCVLLVPKLGTFCIIPTLAQFLLLCACSGVEITWRRVTKSVCAAKNARSSFEKKRTWTCRERNSTCWAWAQCSDIAAGFWQANTKETMWEIPKKSTKTVKTGWMQKH